MQLAVSVAGAVVGGTIGFFVGGPAGAAYGAQLGFALGGIAGSLLIHQNGPAPGDLRVQDSAYGRPIPWYYGIYRGAGNVIWCGQAQQHQPGKGGPPGQTSVTLSFAVGICEGPIAGIRRIWANGKLIWDMSNPSNFQAISGSNQMLQNFRVYLGDENQNPDPTIQAAEGVANTPPFRGLAYVVLNDLDLSQWGNYMPSLTFEVMKTAALSYTQSTIYNIDQSPGLAAWNNTITSIGIDGTITGWQWGSIAGGTLIGIVPFRASPFGATEWQSAVVFNVGLDFPVGKFVNLDGDGGIFTTQGNYYNVLGMKLYSGGYSDFGLSSGISGSAIKKGNVIYGSDATGATARPLYVWDMVRGAVTLGNRPGLYALVGVSGTFMYAVTDGTDATYPNALLKFDLSGNFLASLATNSHFDFGSVGYLVSDTQIYINTAAGLYLWDGTNVTLSPIPQDSAGNVATFAVFGNTAYFSNYVGSSFYAEVPTLTPTTQLLGDVVSDMCQRAGLVSTQYDVSGLTDQVIGYGIGNHSSPRSNLAPLMSAYFVDANDTDNKLKFVRRGAQPVGTFLFADLGASSSIGDQTNETPITEQITQEIDLPRTLAFSYSSFGTDYQQNTQTAFKPDTNSNKDVTAQATIVLTDSDARMRAQVMLWAAWVGRKNFQFTTSLAYLQYEPGDVMTLQGPNGSSYVVRITRCVYDGQGALQWECQLEQPDIYPNGTFTTAGGRALGYSTPPLDYAGPTVFRVLDVPPLRDTDSTPGLYLAACGFADSWPGVIVDMSRDGSSFAQLQRIVTASVVGYTANALANYQGGNTPDELSVLNVTLYHGSLSSVSYNNFMLGNSAALVGGEVIFFRNATQTGANTYQLTGLLRGRAGTDFAMAAHTAGESFVFLDPNALVKQNINVSDIGSTLYYEPHLLNQFLSQAVSPTTATPQDANVKPLRPHLFRALPGSAASTSDISLSWFRRARVFYSWANGTDVPLDQQTEAYTLTISDNAGNVKRTVTVTAATSYVYSTATADGFTTGNTINFSVSQNSSLGVAGFAATASIVR